MSTQTATCVIPLNEANLDILKKMQVNFIDDRPEEAKYIAFLDDGDACFLSKIETSDSLTLILPKMHVLTYYENIVVETTD